MKVSELKNLLENYDGDTEVYFSYAYGDRCGSIVAESVGDVDEKTLVHSEYHQSYRVPEDDDDLDNYDKERKITVVLLS